LGLSFQLWAVALTAGSLSSVAVADVQGTSNDQTKPGSLVPTAQSAAPNKAPAQIIITGSRIPRTNLTAVSPVIQSALMASCSPMNVGPMANLFG